MAAANRYCVPVQFVTFMQSRSLVIVGAVIWNWFDPQTVSAVHCCSDDWYCVLELHETGGFRAMSVFGARMVPLMAFSTKTYAPAIDKMRGFPGVAS